MSDEQPRLGLHPAPPEAVPPFRAAVAQYHDPAKQALIGTVQDGNDLEWDNWQVTIEYGRRSSFDGILDFFANLPSLQGDLADEAVTGQWYWNELEPETLTGAFTYRPEIARLLRWKAGADALITEGWLVKYESGRIDAETTWSDTSYLIGTNGYFAYIQLYMKIIH
jgi:hypothetical protein